jgi:RHS repeat-associated protein
MNRRMPNGTYGGVGAGGGQLPPATRCCLQLLLLGTILATPAASSTAAPPAAASLSARVATAQPRHCYRLWHRYYSAHAGRFISRDPIGFEGGQVNLYAYVANNPVGMRDPSGLIIQVEGPLYAISQELLKKQIQVMLELMNSIKARMQLAQTAAAASAECNLAAYNAASAELVGLETSLANVEVAFQQAINKATAETYGQIFSDIHRQSQAQLQAEEEM